MSFPIYLLKNTLILNLSCWLASPIWYQMHKRPEIINTVSKTQEQSLTCIVPSQLFKQKFKKVLTDTRVLLLFSRSSLKVLVDELECIVQMTAPCRTGSS